MEEVFVITPMAINKLERFFCLINKLEGLTRGWYESGNIKTRKRINKNRVSFTVILKKL